MNYDCVFRSYDYISTVMSKFPTEESHIDNLFLKIYAQKAICTSCWWYMITILSIERDLASFVKCMQMVISVIDLTSTY